MSSPSVAGNWSTQPRGSSATTNLTWDYQTGVMQGSQPSYLRSWMFRRAPGFFDVVCDASTTSAARTINHNLGVPPEIIISKRRNGTSSWPTVTASYYLFLNGNNGNLGSPVYTNFTATTFDISAGAWSSGENWVAYLFATVAGVSKVGSYTGTGTTLQVNCGFTAGARFVLVKATSTTGDWLVWDSARGIVAGNDPYLALNSTAAEVTTTDWVDTYSAGFELSSAGGNLANTNGTSYIFLAVA